jgi:hypothetical protein
MNIISVGLWTISMLSLGSYYSYGRAFMLNNNGSGWPMIKYCVYIKG